MNEEVIKLLFYHQFYTFLSFTRILYCEDLDFFITTHDNERDIKQTDSGTYNLLFNILLRLKVTCFYPLYILF